MKLPRQLAKEGLETAVRAALESENIALYRGSRISIPVLHLNQRLRKHIFYAKSVGDLVFGFESVEEYLANELQGLLNVDTLSDRVSRLLFVTTDGSDRFYHGLEYLQRKQGDRVLICRLNVDSLLMGDILGFKGKTVKAVLLTRKRSVINVLKSLL